MIDIHCHILPGLDDGAENIEEALEMAKLAEADGITDIIVTPHFNNHYKIIKSVVDIRVSELQQELINHKIKIRLHAGNEVRIESVPFVLDHLDQNQFHHLGLNQTHLLIEQRFSDYETSTPELFRHFLELGVTPIIPHPERHYFFREQPELLEELIRLGAWTQVSVDSLLGKNNEEAKRFAEWLIKRDYVHTLATDAHNMNRKPNLSVGVERITSLSGQSHADEILTRMNMIIQ